MQLLKPSYKLADNIRISTFANALPHPVACSIFPRDTMVDLKIKTDDRLSTAELEQPNGPSTTMETSSTINGSPKDIVQDGELEATKPSEQLPVPAEDVPSTPSHLDLEEIVAQGMQFLATAPTEVLGGVLVSLASSQIY